MNWLSRATVVVILAVVGSTSSAFAEGIFLSVEPFVSSTSGNTFVVNVNISEVVDLYAFQFDLGFDPALLAATTVTEGSFLSTGGSTSFLPGSIDNSTGLISFTSNSLTGVVPGINGNGTLAQIGFTALNPGITDLLLSGTQLFDSNHAPIDFSSIDGNVVVQDSASVPEPSSLLLIGSGLLSLLGVKCRLLRKGN